MSDIAENYVERRAAAEAALLAQQPEANLRAAGVCPSLTIAAFEEPEECVVYCEHAVPPDGTHVGSHMGLAGVGKWEHTYYWQWPNP